MSLVSANKTETNTYSIEIAVSAEDFKNAVQQAYLKNRKNITIPGFRKGKAPKAMIEKLYGDSFFYEDALEDLFPGEIEAAYKEADIKPVDQPRDLDIKTMNVTEGLNFTVNVTVKPEITLKAYKELEAEKEDASVSAEEIDREIGFMLDRGSRLVDIDDRAAEKGDITVIDFEGFVDGVAFDGGKAEKYNLTLGEGQFIPGFEDQIIGHSIGDEFDINVKFPDDYAPELASKDAVFKIKLHEIKVKEVPELDDEFAKDQGDYETVDELKKGVEEDLLAHKKEHAQHAFEDRVVNALCENVEGEIPDCMYENKANENINNFAQRVQQQGINLETYLSYMGMDLDTFKKDMKERAVNDVKYDLAVEKIIELEGITADEAAIEEEYGKMAEQYGLDVEKIKELVPSEMVADELNKRAAIKAVIDSAKAVPPAPIAKAEEKKEEAAE
ncbi:MAG: trigger factor [Clostridia bacterium]|nr:trigger factor [Clostridia bacterium]